MEAVEEEPGGCHAAHLSHPAAHLVAERDRSAIMGVLTGHQDHRDEA